MTPRELYAQGDLLIERVDTAATQGRSLLEPDVDGAVVLERGEVSGHRHAILAGALLFRDDALARDIPPALYVGHLEVTAPAADLVHEEHETISLPRGCYRVRRQREYEGPANRRHRLVED